MRSFLRLYNNKIWTFLQWQTQHTGISCEQFANWQRDNNPELSHEAIGNYLQKNGIECPKCKFKYDLSRYEEGAGKKTKFHELMFGEK